MSNSGNKGIISNNIGSSVGAFTKRNSTDAGSSNASGSTTERRRVSPLESICPHLIVLIPNHLLAPHPEEVVPQSPHQPPMQSSSALDQRDCHPRFLHSVMTTLTFLPIIVLRDQIRGPQQPEAQLAGRGSCSSQGKFRGAKQACWVLRQYVAELD